MVVAGCYLQPRGGVFRITCLRSNKLNVGVAVVSNVFWQRGFGQTGVVRLEPSNVHMRSVAHVDLRLIWDVA